MIANVCHSVIALEQTAHYQFDVRKRVLESFGLRPGLSQPCRFPFDNSNAGPGVHRLPGLSRKRGSKAVGQILSAGFSRGLVRRLAGRPVGSAFRACVALGIVLIPASYLAAQASSHNPNQSKKNKPVVPTVAQPPVAATQLQARPMPAPVLLTPPLPPVVEWDGKKLTIDADNSTLSDILLAIRSHTGASIDMPGSASAERVAVHLGPAPIREVIASLLYGTDFDYVIQGSDADEYGLKSVTLTARGQGDDSNSIDAPQQAGVRLMPGYAAPGKRTYEVMQEKPAENTASAVDSNAAGDPAPTQESASASGDPASSAPPAAANPNSPSASPSESADVGGPIGTPSPVTPSGETSSADASASGNSSISQMEQNLQRLYQQRQKLQAQQNQGAPPSGK